MCICRNIKFNFCDAVVKHVIYNNKVYILGYDPEIGKESFGVYEFDGVENPLLVKKGDIEFLNTFKDIIYFTVNGKYIKRFNKPPFNFMWDTGRLPDGPHKFRIEGFGRSGDRLTALEIDIIKDSELQTVIQPSEKEKSSGEILLLSPEEENDAPQ